ncbi:membrane hypothetical protein [Frankia sp. Hr75.2]|uniref:hypothetical protein n=1 Tax=Parafrankia soli TaxID=2599596 RepID=UPI0028A41FEC|nr:membrane hypothetical protein [Frankia sp. Hr75.2]
MMQDASRGMRLAGVLAILSGSTMLIYGVLCLVSIARESAAVDVDPGVYEARSGRSVIIAAGGAHLVLVGGHLYRSASRRERLSGHGQALLAAGCLLVACGMAILIVWTSTVGFAAGFGIQGAGAVAAGFGVRSVRPDRPGAGR